jgi:hypothetical protein
MLTKMEGFEDGTGDKTEEAQIGFLVADGQASILAHGEQPNRNPA